MKKSQGDCAYQDRTAFASQSDLPQNTPRPVKSNRGFLISLFYFYVLEGIPYGLQSRFLPLVLRSRGVSLTKLGFYKLLYLPWLFKSFYAPFVEITLTKRIWLLLSLFFLFIITAALSVIFDTIFSNSSILWQSSSMYLAVFLLMYNLSAATQDIAVDGLALNFLSSHQLALGNAIQVVGYKLGAIFGGGCLAFLSAFFPTSKLLGAIAFIYVIGIGVCIYFEESVDCTPKTVKEKTSKPIGSAPRWNILKDIMNSPGSLTIIALLLIYKLGEQGAMNMLPLMLLDHGASVAQVGLWCTTIGQIMSIAGSTAGYKCQNFGLSLTRLLFWLMCVRLLLHLPLVLIASQSTGGILVFGLAAIIMNMYLFVSGTITTAMFTLMMHCTRSEAGPHVQATHYTVLSTAELLGKLLFGIVAATLTEMTGYAVANGLFILLSALPLYLINKHCNLLMFDSNCIRVSYK